MQFASLFKGIASQHWDAIPRRRRALVRKACAWFIRVLVEVHAQFFSVYHFVDINKMVVCTLIIFPTSAK